MANPFSVAVPTIDLNQFNQGFETTRKMRERNATLEAAKLAQTGDYEGAARQLLGLGNIDAGVKLAALAATQRKEGLAQQASLDFNSILNGPATSPAYRADTGLSNQPAAAPLAVGRSNESPGRVYNNDEVSPLDPVPSINLTGPDKTITGISYEDANGNQQRFAQAPQAAAPSMPLAPTPAPIPSGLSTKAALIVRGLSNPYLPAANRQVGLELLKAELANSKVPDNVREYLFARSSGDPNAQVPITEWSRGNKRAGAMTVDMRAESAEAAALGKGAGERANATMDAARAATKTSAQLNRISNLLTQVNQGRLEPARMNISAWAKSFGLDDTVAERLGLDPKRVGDAQALNALTSELVIGKIGSGGFPANNFSDADRSFLLGTVQQLGNDPRANRIITEIGKRIAQRDIDKGKEWMKFRRSNPGKSYDDFEIQWADRVAREDLFDDLAAEAAQLAPRQQQQQGAMPQGARQAPDGNFYVPDPSRPGKYLKVVQ
jgi:hypothetical protein